LLPGAPWDAASRKMAPHIVLNVPHDCALHTREIFGPILPVIGYTELDAVIKSINAGPRPLAFYPFTHQTHTVDKLIKHVMSGGVGVNNALFHAAQHSMPFGGVGDSGMGHYHGHEGFVTFSKLRPVFYQSRVSGMRMMWPPYRQLADKYLKFLLK
jgi:coniferyl-aldehyde dehydrogenase